MKQNIPMNFSNIPADSTCSRPNNSSSTCSNKQRHCVEILDSQNVLKCTFLESTKLFDHSLTLLVFVGEVGMMNVSRRQRWKFSILKIILQIFHFSQRSHNFPKNQCQTSNNSPPRLTVCSGNWRQNKKDEKIERFHYFSSSFYFVCPGYLSVSPVDQKCAHFWCQHAYILVYNM